MKCPIHSCRNEIGNPFLQEWTTHSIPQGMKWYHSIPAGMDCSFNSPWNEILPFHSWRNGMHQTDAQTETMLWTAQPMMEKGLFNQVSGMKSLLILCPDGFVLLRLLNIWICPLQQDISSRSEDLKGCHPQRLKGIVLLFTNTTWCIFCKLPL